MVWNKIRNIISTIRSGLTSKISQIIFMALSFQFLALGYPAISGFDQPWLVSVVFKHTIDVDDIVMLMTL